jgi:hypothetical protein
MSTVQVADVLDHLVAKSAAPSSFGAQLDRMRFGIQVTPDPFRAREEAENKLLQSAALLRCIDQFEARYEFSVTTRQRATSAAGYKVLDRIQKATKRGQGEIALGILRAYHERVTCSIGQSQERGLLAVYTYVAGIAPDAVPAPPKDTDDLLMAFRTGSAKRARNMAAEAYADALLALQNHVRVYNKKKGAR